MINRESGNSQRVQVLEGSDSRIGDRLILIQQKPEQEVSKKHRLNSLDVHRGITMMGMIVVDNCGPYPWWIIDHSEWDGLTPADLVFPSFLFIMGFAIPLAVSQKNPIGIKTIVRIFALILIGVFLELVDCKFNFYELRIPGILQRLGICYGIVVLVHAVTNYGQKDRRMFGAFLIFVFGVVYLAFMLPFSDESIGCTHDKNLTPFCNFGSFLDRKIFTIDHMFQQGQNDPEGLFTNTNAVISTYTGYYFSLIMFDNKAQIKKTVFTWIIISLVMGAISYPLTFLMPFNKKIYSTSYLFLSNGIAGITLSLLVILIDLMGKNSNVYQKIVKVVTFPFIWLGRNPLAMFFLMNIQSSLLGDYIYIGDNSVEYLIFKYGFNSWISDKVIACTILAAVYWIFWTLIAGILYRFKIFIKV